MKVGASLRLFRLSIIVFVFPLLLHSGLKAVSAQESVKLKEVKIEGNVRVEDDGIRLHLKMRAGEVFDPAVVDQDVKAIYRNFSVNRLILEATMGIEPMVRVLQDYAAVF